MIKITPEVSWWWKPFKKPITWLQLQLGIFIDWEPPYFTFGVDLIIVKLGLKIDWSAKKLEPPIRFPAPGNPY